MRRASCNAGRRLTAVTLAAALLSFAQPRPGHALAGCPEEAERNGDKVIIGSVAELGISVGERVARSLVASFEMHFAKAEADLRKKARILYCKGRPVRDDSSYNSDVASQLNDQQILLEVGTSSDGSDILVTYVVIPVLRYAPLDETVRDEKGVHKAVYEQSRISAGLDKLFQDNAELRLMTALALAVRHEKLADGEPDERAYSELLDLSRGFYCDAIGSLEKAKPRAGFLGLPQSEWQSLHDFAHAGARRLFATATGDSRYVGTLSVVNIERAGEGDDRAACR